MVFSVSFATLALFYNKDLLNTAPKTFEEINTLVKSLIIHPSINMLCYGMYKIIMFHVCFITLYRANEFGKTGNDPKALGIASSEAKKGLETMKRLKKANPSNPLDMGNPQVLRGLFNEGKVAVNRRTFVHARLH